MLKDLSPFLHSPIDSRVEKSLLNWSESHRITYQELLADHSVQYLQRLESLQPQLGSVGSFPAQTPYNQNVGTTGEEQGQRINGVAPIENLT